MDQATHNKIVSFIWGIADDVLREETDPNKLHDQKTALDEAQVYMPEQINSVVDLFISGAEREKLDPILDVCVVAYKDKLDEDGQVEFKGKAKAFTRTYSFLASILPYSNAEWEKLSIFLNLLIPKLPAPKEEDLSKGILESIDMDSYRVEKKAAMKIALPDENAEIGPVPVESSGHKAQPELDRLSNILKIFNEHFGTLFADTDRVVKRIKDDIAPQVASDPAFQNAKLNTPNTLTWFFTGVNFSVSKDIAERSFFIEYKISSQDTEATINPSK